MKKTLILTDFDNTITKKDFYWILIDDYIGEKGKKYYQEWKATKKIGTEFLNEVFGWKKLSEEDHLEAIEKVEIDDKFLDLVSWAKGKGIPIEIVSAGFDYYIHKVLKKFQLEDIKVHTNPGVFEEGIFQMKPNPDSETYSPIYGIDKAKVIKKLKEEYEWIIFIGDSEPDYHAAVFADLVFGKTELLSIMQEEHKDCIEYTNFGDILSKLQKTY